MRARVREAQQRFSYAHGVETSMGRNLIRLMEKASGKRRLVSRAQGYGGDVALGHGFFDMMAKRCGLSLDLTAGSPSLIPRVGPVIVVANHPYGILDGLMLGQILSQRREDFRIIANSVFDVVPEVKGHVLPVSFERDQAALALNLETRRRSLAHLRAGGAIGVFPGGTVSTGARAFDKPMDPGWGGFTARMIARSRAEVVPVYFDGQTSAMFQIASHLHVNLRLGLLMREFERRLDRPVRVAVGTPLGRDVLDPLSGDAKAMMDFLRKATYDLSPKPLAIYPLGLEIRQ